MIEFTGERFVPSEDGEIAYEHWHRYGWCRSLVTGRRVLDVACGEGYGAALLAAEATEVVGVDLSGDAIEHARQAYASVSNLVFQQGSATAIPFPDASFDVVVSYETIEHLAEQTTMIAELRRVLRADGVLVISSPNRPVYSEARNYRNEFHVKELDLSEFVGLLESQFGAIRLYGQRLATGSFILPDSAGEQSYQAVTRGEGASLRFESANLESVMYYVAVCGGEGCALPELPPSVYLDRAVDLYARYQDVALWASDIDRQFSELGRAHRRLQREHEQRSRWAVALDQEVARLAEQLAALQGELDERTSWAIEADQARLKATQDYEALVQAFDARSRWADTLVAELEALRDKALVTSPQAPTGHGDDPGSVHGSG